MIAEYRRPGDVDRTRASQSSLRGGHHMKCPGRDGCEAKEGEQQAGACPEPNQGTDIVATQAHDGSPRCISAGPPLSCTEYRTVNAGPRAPARIPGVT